MASTANPTRDDFEALLNEQLGGAADGGFEGRVVKGTVTSVENGMVIIDVGLKSEGRIDIKEFQRAEDETAPKVGDEVEVYVDRVENSEGEAMLSRDRARREAAWDKLENEFGEGKRVDGRIFGRVKGGFTVDLDGAVAFLPGSQVDIRPVRDVGPLMDMPQPFQILKMDRRGVWHPRGWCRPPGRAGGRGRRFRAGAPADGLADHRCRSWCRHGRVHAVRGRGRRGGRPHRPRRCPGHAGVSRAPVGRADQARCNGKPVPVAAVPGDRTR